MSVLNMLALAGKLPSMNASAEFLNGNPEKLGEIVAISAGRAAEIALGIALSGEWDRDAWRNAVLGSLSVQSFVLLYAYWHRNNSQQTLPSWDSANAVVSGDLSQLPIVGVHWFGRAVLVAAGIYAAGERKSLLKQALWGSAVMEASLLTYAAFKRKETL